MANRKKKSSKISNKPCGRPSKKKTTKPARPVGRPKVLYADIDPNLSDSVRKRMLNNKACQRARAKVQLIKNEKTLELKRLEERNSELIAKLERLEKLVLYFRKSKGYHVIWRPWTNPTSALIFFKE